MSFCYGLLESLCRGLTIVAILGMAACVSAPPKVEYKSIIVPVTKYIPVPKKYLTQCPIATPSTNTVHEALIVAKKRKTALINCNQQLDSISHIQGADVNGGH